MNILGEKFIETISRLNFLEGVFAERVAAFASSPVMGNDLTDEELEGVCTLLNKNTNKISIWGEEYLVLTKEESISKCREYIFNSLKDISPEVLSYFLGIGSDVVSLIQETVDGNESIMKKFLEKGNLDNFVETTINTYGRGYFVATHNKVEEIQEINNRKYFIYQIK